MKLKLMLPFLLLLTVAAHAQQPEIYKVNGLGAHGLDVVSLVNELPSIKGEEKYSYDWNGARWLFISQAHVDSFKVAPEKYAPQYGGYCAFGTSRGYKAPTESDTWTVVANRLYFNYNLKVKEAWSKNTDAYIHKADSSWQIIRTK